MASTMILRERAAELTRLNEALRLASNSAGSVLIVDGPGGIGKTRLLSEARASAERGNFRVLHARAAELERDYAFGVVLQLLEPVIAAASVEQRRYLLRHRAALAEPLLTGGDLTACWVTLNEEHSLMHGLYWFLVNLAESRPIALLVDDVHWADRPSLRFLSYLARRVSDLPLALVATVRTDEQSEEAEMITRLIEISESPTLRLAELSIDATRDLLNEVFPYPFERDFVEVTWEMTGGNPFLLSEVVSQALNEPALWSENPGERMRNFAPDSVSRNVASRLMRLGPKCLRLARARALIGDDCPLHLALELSELEGTAASSATQQLIAANIFGAADTIGFTHPMIRSAVYEAIDETERPALHTAAASLLHRTSASPEKIAYHLLAGSPTDATWAPETLQRAAREAARKGSPSSAVRYLRRAVELDHGEQLVSTLLIDLGLAEAAAGETTAVHRFEDALTRLSDPHEKGRAMYALGQTLYRYGRHSEAATAFRRGTEVVSGNPQDALMFEAGYMCSAQYVVALRHELRDLLDAHRNMVECTPHSVARLAVLANIALDTAMSPGRQPEAAQHAARLAERALANDELLRAEGSESMAINLAILALLWSGHPTAAQHAIDQVLGDARDRGAALAFAEASMVRALINYARGRVTAAAADAQAAIDGMEGGCKSMVPTPQAVLAQCFIDRGEFGQAEAVLQSVDLVLTGPSTHRMKSWFHGARGRLRLEREDWKGAYVDFVEAGACLEDYLAPAASPAMIPWRSRAGLAAQAMGDRRNAEALINEEIEISREAGLGAQLGSALRCRAILQPESAALEDLTAAIEMLEQADSQLELGHALLEFGRRQSRAGDLAAARENLRRSLDLAHRCGAKLAAERAREELLTAGARPRRDALTGVSSLTPTEQRIAEKAAAGRTARGIAEDLFVSKNTVEWHMRRIYRKLGIKSRSELKDKIII